MYWDDFRKCFADAERTMKQADDVAENRANMLRGRLRKVSPYVLKQLKHELSQFNARNLAWKEQA